MTNNINIIVLPHAMSFRDWTDAITRQLAIFGTIPRVDRDDEWQRWGSNLLSISALSGIGIPDPNQFSDWRRWAERVIGAFASINV